MSPTQRCLADLRKLGHIAAVVEKWNPHSKTRHDLFGFCDVIYLTGASIVAVQVTSGSNHSARRAKILGCPWAEAWLVAGGLVEVWSYTSRPLRLKSGLLSEKLKEWTLRKEELVLEDFHDRSAAA